MLTSLIVSALTCLAMNWLELHVPKPTTKESTHASTQAVTR